MGTAEKRFNDWVGSGAEGRLGPDFCRAASDEVEIESGPLLSPCGRTVVELGRDP